MSLCFKIICFAILLASCVYTEKTSDSLKEMINQKHSTLERINFEGSFTPISKYFLETPTTFFKNGLVYYDFADASDSVGYNTWVKKYFAIQKGGWGTYSIVDDTIKAIVYVPYYDAFAHYIQTNFQGIIKDKNTILNWHVVKPYPKLKKNLFEGFQYLLNRHYDLYLKRLSIRPVMDSIAEKAWINKYRNNNMGRTDSN